MNLEDQAAYFIYDVRLHMIEPIWQTDIYSFLAFLFLRNTWNLKLQYGNEIL